MAARYPILIDPLSPATGLRPPRWSGAL